MRRLYRLYKATDRQTQTAQRKFTLNHLILGSAFTFLAVIALFLIVAIYSHNESDGGWAQTIQPNMAFHNLAGAYGAYFSDFFLSFFGFTAYILPFFLLTLAVRGLLRLFRHKIDHVNYFSLSFILLGLLGFTLFFSGFCTLIIRNSESINSGGILGYLVAQSLGPMIGYDQSAWIILLFLAWICMTLVLHCRWLIFFEKVGYGLTLLVTYPFLQHDDEEEDDENDEDNEGNEPSVVLDTDHRAPQTQTFLNDTPAFMTLNKQHNESSDSCEPNDTHENCDQSEKDPHHAETERAASPQTDSSQSLQPTIYYTSLISNTLRSPNKSYHHGVDHDSDETSKETPASEEINLSPKENLTPTEQRHSPQDTTPPQEIIKSERAPFAVIDVIDDTEQPFESKVDNEEKVNNEKVDNEKVNSENVEQTQSKIDSEYVQLKTNESNPQTLSPVTSQSVINESKTIDNVNTDHNEPVDSMNTMDNVGNVNNDHSDDEMNRKTVSSEHSEETQTAQVITGEVLEDDETPHFIHPLLRKDQWVIEKPTTRLPLPSILPIPAKQEIQLNVELLKHQGELLEQSLMDYRVKCHVVGYEPGPVITRFEIELAPGVKASRISGLDRDIARSLSLPSVRVVEVIPGKPYIGIELPNPTRQTVYFRDVLDSPQFQNSTSPLTMILGKDISGQTVVADLAKMPHLLVAGTTGSGKSVGVNAMILSILFKAGPDEVRFIMIDPKMLELSIYKGIPHLLTDVVTDMKDAANALNWCVEEMDRRYTLMAKLSVRNVAGYNAKIDQAEAMGQPILDPTWTPTSDMLESIPALEKLPYIVVVVDEFADLMMTAGKKVEELIARLAQKARAAGIHLILATQRPSVDVITGLIKANIPTRIAFTVSSKIDSRTILDQMGAETLLGMGDMLYLGPNSSIPIRVHGAFMSDDEVQRVVEDWKARNIQTEYIDTITEDIPETSGSGNDLDDALYDEAAQFVIAQQKVSISLIQRQFNIGYNRAARITERLEREGVISAPLRNSTREVLVARSSSQFDERFSK